MDCVERVNRRKRYSGTIAKINSHVDSLVATVL
jgi:hypothetical protein